MTTPPTATPLDEWASQARASLTGDKLARFDKAIIDTDGQPDSERYITLGVTHQYLMGALDVDKAGTALKAARVMEIRARMAAKQIAKLAIEDGATEHGTAKKLGVDRMAIRKWLGKK